MLYKNKNLRNELKYILSPYYYEIIRARVKSVLSADKNGADGEYRVTSLYFEDIYRSSYNDKLSGDFARHKYRIRSYNLSRDKITLEVKYKDAAYVSKLNASLSSDDYDKFIIGDFSFYYENEDKWKDTAMERFMISNALVRPRPSVVVDYRREAYISDAGNLRLTFDKQLSTCCETIDMFSPCAVYSPVMDCCVILEIKYDSFLPILVEQLLAGFPLVQESVSKFIICTDKLLEEKKQCIF